MTWTKTLRFRFALGVGGVLLAALVVFGALVYVSLAQGLAASIDDSLALAASQALAAVDIEGGAINYADSIPRGGAAADLVERGLTIRMLDDTGRVRQAVGRFRELEVDPSALAAAFNQQTLWATYPEPGGQESVRVYTVPILVGGQPAGVLQVAQSLDPVQATLDRLLVTLLLAGPGLVAVAALGGYSLAARALAPIDHMTRTARRISAEDLSERLNLAATDDEVGRLAATFDSMLTRLDEAFRRERRFTADASHELRTPLTAMQSILSVIRAERRTVEDYEQALADLDQEAGRLRHLVDDLLRLAHQDAQPLTTLDPIDLTGLLRDVCESLRTLATAKGLALACDIPDGLQLAGDRDGLIRLFVNLLHNAIKYTARGEISVCARRAEAGLVVKVQDTGTGIAAEHLPHLFDRFYRVDTSRSAPGNGLGLAIAAGIARAHGGTIQAVSTPGSGSSFSVHLPA